MSLLEVADLRITLPGDRGRVRVVDGVNLSVEHGEVVGIAGESGSGKTITVSALMGLLPRGVLVQGTVRLNGRDLLTLSRRQLRDVRGHHVSMIFQDPSTSLHPMLTIRRQITEHLCHHLGVSPTEAQRRGVELLNEVRIPDPERALTAYPHQFSGGMKQRIAIAIALACGPKLLIADEPTTSLDVTVQAGILRLLDRLRTQSDLSIIVITHDLGVISAIADRLLIFYAGRVVESGPTAKVLAHPRHPYTRGLVDALPRAGASQQSALKGIPGSPAVPGEWPSGCSFHPRCGYRLGNCADRIPVLIEVAPDRKLACHVDPFEDE